MLLERLELPDGGEEVDKLANTSAEKLELAEDLSGVEIELAGLGHGLKALLGEHVGLDVAILEVLAGLENSNELVVGVLLLVPETAILESAGHFDLGVGEGAHLSLAGKTELDVAEVDDVVLAVSDHLVGDLDEKASHALGSVVVAGDGVDHLDGVHQGGESVLDGLGVANVEGLKILLERLEVLDVVLGLREGLSDLVVDASPVGGGHVDLLVGDSELFRLGLAGVLEEVIDGAAVLAAELLADLGQLSHALLPVVELLDGAVVLVVAALSVGVIDVGVDLLLPSAEDVGVLVDNLNSTVSLTKTSSLGIAQGVEDDVALEGLLGLHELLGELVEGLHELLLLVGLAHLPLSSIHFVEHGLVDVVNEGLEDTNGVLRDLAEQDVFVGGGSGGDGGASLGVSHEVNTLASQLDVVTYNEQIWSVFSHI